jgi:hypothetical protein
VPWLGAVLDAEEARQRTAAEFWPSLEALARRLALASGVAALVIAAFLAGMEWSGGLEPPAAAQNEIREMVPRPVQIPANQDEVLISLASRGNGR